MELKQALTKLNKSQEYKEVVKENKDVYFSYALDTIENSKTTPWQLGFYNKSIDKMTTFVIGNKIEVQKEEEIFKKPGMEVKQIDMEKVKIPFNKIIKNSNEFKRKKYPDEIINKTIAILQNLNEYGTIWNITFVTDSFKTLNMKLNAENGKILHHNLDSIMNFVKK